MRFKKHKFISAEKLAQTFFGVGVKKINVTLEENSIVTVDNIVRTGFAQYAFTKMEDREVVVKCMNEESQVSKHYFNVNFSELWKVKGFEYLEGYAKIKPLYTIRDWRGEKMDIEGLAFPSGELFKVELLGILIKGDKNE